MTDKAFIGNVDIDLLAGKYVLLRVDFNVPLKQTKDGYTVYNDTRIRSSLPTIRYLKSNGAKVIICSHLGRPKGKFEKSMSLVNVAQKLSELLDGAKVSFVDDCVGVSVQLAAKKLEMGDILLLENLRFHPEEEANGEDFARQLATGMDIFVNDAFGAAHRGLHLLF